MAFVVKWLTHLAVNQRLASSILVKRPIILQSEYLKNYINYLHLL